MRGMYWIMLESAIWNWTISTRDGLDMLGLDCFMLGISDLEMGQIMDWIGGDGIFIASVSAIWKWDDLDMSCIGYHMQGSRMKWRGGCLDMQG